MLIIINRQEKRKYIEKRHSTQKITKKSERKSREKYIKRNWKFFFVNGVEGNGIYEQLFPSHFIAILILIAFFIALKRNIIFISRNNFIIMHLSRISTIKCEGRNFT